MECVSIKNAKYVRDYIIYVECSDGVSGEVDLKEIVYRHNVAKPLRDVATFAKFYLDEWPTLAWKCGFDIAPEALHAMCACQEDISRKVAESTSAYGRTTC